MLKITKTSEDEGTVTLMLDGRVDGTTLSDLEKLCLQYNDQENKVVLLDFSGVTFISSSGLRALEKMKYRRIRMINGSLFVETLLGELKE
jgi:anti-anti-sigma factor